MQQMNDVESIRQQPSLWRRLVAFKTLLITLSIATLMASNVASLVSSGAHDWMHSALWRVLAIGSHVWADRAFSNSPKQKLENHIRNKTADLDNKNKRLIADNELKAKQLAEAQVGNKKLAQKLDANGKLAKETVSKVHKRLATGIARNVVALPSVAVPYLGIGVTLAVTSLNIYDSCQTMKDFNTLLQMLGQGEEKPELCGQKVPTVDEVLDSAKTEWRSSVQRVAEESKAIKISVPEANLPSRDEVVKAFCAVGSVPYICPAK